jgi:hypothetical protein
MEPDVIKDMKNSEKGAVVYFDTSSMKNSHYFAGMDDSEKYSLESQSLYDDLDSFESEGNDKRKMKRFHKSRCKAWIVSVERVEDREFNCVIFVEMDRHKDLNHHEEVVQTELKEVKQEEIVEEKKIEEKSIGDENTENKQEDDIRHIKDSRAMLNEKKNSKSIKTLQRLFIIFALICIGSETFLRVKRSQDSADQNNYVQRFLALFDRNFIMADVGYYLRKYERIIK